MGCCRIKIVLLIALSAGKVKRYSLKTVKVHFVIKKNWDTIENWPQIISFFNAKTTHLRIIPINHVGIVWMQSGLEDYSFLMFCVDLRSCELLIHKVAVQIRAGDFDVSTNTVLKRRIAKRVLAVCHVHFKSGTAGLTKWISKVAERTINYTVHTKLVLTNENLQIKS